MNREKLGLLTAKTMSFRPRISGGISEYGAEEVAYIKAHISASASKYLDLVHNSVKESIDKRWLQDVAYDLRRRIHKIEALEYWMPPRPNWILDMAYMALYEDVQAQIGANKCPWCKGRGEYKTENLVVPCDGCKQSGLRAVENEDRAKMMGVDEDYWQQWTNRYRRCFSHIDKWLDEIHTVDSEMRKKDESQ